MFQLLLIFLRSAVSGFRSHRLLLLENLALRQQLAVLQWRKPKPSFRPIDRLFWLSLRRFCPNWKRILLLVQPQTVIAWHRQGFRWFWRWKSQHRGGRPTVNVQLIQQIRTIWSENPVWGSKRIQAELTKLGINVSDATVRKYRPKGRRGQQTWKTFLAPLLPVHFLNLLFDDANRLVEPIRVTAHPLDFNGRKPVWSKYSSEAKKSGLGQGVDWNSSKVQ